MTESLSYLGNIPAFGEYKKLDDISTSFNGVLTTFNARVGGINTALNSTRQCLISVNGVVQEPDIAYTIGANPWELVFFEAPASSSTFFGIIAGNRFDTIAVSDGAVTNSKLADGAVTAPKITDNTITSAKLLDGTITDVKLASNSVTNAKIIDNAVTLQKIQDNAVTSAKIASNAVTTAKIADSNITYPKISPSIIATGPEISAGAASKLVSAAALAPLLAGTEGTSLYQTTGTTMVLNTWISMNFDTTEYDDGNWHTGGAAIVTPFAGRISLVGTIDFGVSGNAIYAIRLIKNGSPIKYGTAIIPTSGSGPQPVTFQITDESVCAPGDSFELQGHTNNSGNITGTGIANTSLKVRRIK